MKRDRATTILKRILATIDSGADSGFIREVWVFGSYALGVVEPGDIDLILIHDDATAELRADFEAEAKQRELWEGEALHRADRRYRSMIKTPLRRPGEAVDMLLGPSLENVLSRYGVARAGPRTLLWSRTERDWDAALRSIPFNPLAVRPTRTEFLSAKVAGCSFERMHVLTALIKGDAITATKMQPEEWPIRLPKKLQARTDHWVDCRAMGRKSLSCLPLGMWWLMRQGCKDAETMNREIHNQHWSLVVTFGRLDVWRILSFLNRPSARAAAHVIHFRQGAPREVLDFRRGSAWDQRDQLVNSAMESARS